MADLEPEEGRHKWSERLKRLTGCLSFLWMIYKIVREIHSRL